MAFKYGGDRRRSEDVIRDSKTSGGLYDSYLLPDINSFRSHEGENKIRILPGTWTEPDGGPAKDWAFGVYLHYGIGPDETAFICAAKMKPGSPCVICEARKQATDEEELYALKFNWRPHAWLIDRKNEKAGPLLWGMPVKQMFNEINARSVDRHTGEILLIDHPEKGYDLFFDREGSKKRTAYKAIDIARDPSVLSRNEDNFWVDEDKEGNVIYGGDWIDYINENPIPELLVYHEQDYIESILFARPTEKGRGRGGDDNDRPSRRGDREEREREAEDIRGRRRGEDDEPPRRRSRDAEDDPPRRRASTEDDPPRRRASEDDDPPRRRSRDENDDAPKGEDPPRRRRLATDDDDAPARRTRDTEEDAPRRRASEDDDPPRRRSQDAEDDPPRRRERTNGGSDDEASFEPRSRSRSNEDEGDPTKTAKAALEDMKNERRIRD